MSFRSMVMLLIAASVVAFVPSCLPSHGLSVEDYDTVLTGYIPGTPFTSYRTYAMPDTIVYVGDDTDKLLGRSYDALILSMIARNLEARGFRRIVDTLQETPDVMVYVAGTASSFTSYYSSWNDYWDGYWGWGWGPYYPPYWGPSYGSATYNIGRINIDMVDRGIAVGRLDNPIVWSGSLSGLLAGTISRVYLTTKINQLFEQSPYLVTGGVQ